MSLLRRLLEPMENWLHKISAAWGRSSGESPSQVDRAHRAQRDLKAAAGEIQSRLQGEIMDQALRFVWSVSGLVLFDFFVFLGGSLFRKELSNNSAICFLMCPISG